MWAVPTPDSCSEYPEVGHSSPSIIRMIKSRRMGRACSMNGENRNDYRIFVGKPEGKRLIERSRSRWEDNIKMNPRAIGWGCMNWINLAQDKDHWRAFVNTVMNLVIP
jgi:hypothetical protein